MSNCSDCGGELEQGCLIDFSYGTALVQRYSRSQDIPSSRLGISLKPFEATFEDSRRVLARRCKKCNKISLYAQDLVDEVNINLKSNKLILIIMFITLVVVVVGVMVSLDGY